MTQLFVCMLLEYAYQKERELALSCNKLAMTRECWLKRLVIDAAFERLGHDAQFIKRARRGF